jgi:hypothetical protein
MPSSSTPLVPPRSPRVDEVRTWRLEELLRAGYPKEEAFLLSGAPGVDLHLAVTLLEQGCPVETALRILL